MEEILARYLDGELTDAEAAEFLRLAEQDPAFERDVHDYEMILRSAERLPRPAAPLDLGDKVMGAVGRSSSRQRRSLSLLRGWAWLAAAATLVLGLGIGFVSGRANVLGTHVPAAVQPPGVMLPAALHEPGPGVEYLRAVQLVYTATNPEVRSVSVAGSFNGWDPATGPMATHEGVWRILLVLPPGAHEYMFIENGDRWITDPNAPGTRPDGFGGSNGVLNVSL